jgi:hypothetical protein
MGRWPGLLLSVAALLSMLLHLGWIFNEQIYAWVTQKPFTESELKKVTQKLSAIKDAASSKPAGLAGVKPVENQVVYLQKGQKPQPIAPVPPKAQPKAKVKTVASAVSVAKASEPASAASAAVAKPVVAVASSVPEVASQVAQVIVDSQLESTLPPLKESPLMLEQSYPAQVEITYAYGIFPIRMSWKAEAGHYALRLRGALFSKSREFISNGEVGPEGVIPQRFVDYRDGKMINEALFDWKAKQVTLNDGGSSKLEALKTGDQDIFSAAFQLALQGAKMKDFTFTIASGRKIYKDVPFEISGQASLHLGDRQIEAILLRGRFEDRTFDFWLAPQWHNMPVRMTLSLGSEGSFDIWANDIKINGEMVLEPPSNSRNANSNRMMRR